MNATICCLDKYEAQKLSNLIYVKEGDRTFVTEITGVFSNELVITLDDGSAHSILLLDGKNAEMLADFLQSVTEKKHRITETAAAGSTVRITKG